MAEICTSRENDLVAVHLHSCISLLSESEHTIRSLCELVPAPKTESDGKGAEISLDAMLPAGFALDFDSGHFEFGD